MTVAVWLGPGGHCFAIVAGDGRPRLRGVASASGATDDARAGLPLAVPPARLAAGATPAEGTPPADPLRAGSPR
jgi:hypothetical protein